MWNLFSLWWCVLRTFEYCSAKWSPTIVLADLCGKCCAKEGNTALANIGESFRRFVNGGTSKNDYDVSLIGMDMLDIFTAVNFFGLIGTFSLFCIFIFRTSTHGVMYVRGLRVHMRPKTGVWVFILTKITIASSWMNGGCVFQIYHVRRNSFLQLLLRIWRRDWSVLCQ